jgi:hypothetical protein
MMDMSEFDWVDWEAKKYENLMRWLKEHLPENVRTRDDFVNWCLEVIKGVDDTEDIRIKVAEATVFKEKRGESWSLFVAEEQRKRGTGTYVSHTDKSYSMVAWIALIPVHPKKGSAYVFYYDTEAKKLIKKTDALRRMGASD